MKIFHISTRYVVDYLEMLNKSKSLYIFYKYDKSQPKAKYILSESD